MFHRVIQKNKSGFDFLTRGV